MWKLAIFLLVISMVNTQCTCGQFTDEASCYAYGYCVFADNQCSEQKCEGLPFEGKCTAPLCQWSGEKCTTFKPSATSCAALLPQECNNYGCYYDYTNLKCGITRTCKELQIDQCNGQTAKGNLCVVDPIAETCEEMSSCQSLTTEFACSSQNPNCAFDNGSCEPTTCSDVKDSTSCNYKDECAWANNKCSKKACQDIKFGYLCNGSFCGWNNNQCFQCIQESALALQIIFIALLLLV